MQAHDEERDIYGAIYVQRKKYFLLENRPTRRDLWMEGMNKWLVADEESVEMERNPEIEVGQPGDYFWTYVASYIVVGSDALIDLLPVPQVKKVIRFYITDDEEA